MTAIEEIHKVQGQVATMQSYLAGAENILETAEEIAMAGRAVKRGFRRLIFFPVALLGVIALIIIWRKFKMRESRSVSAIEVPESS